MSSTSWKELWFFVISKLNFFYIDLWIFSNFGNKKTWIWNLYSPFNSFSRMKKYNWNFDLINIKEPWLVSALFFFLNHDTVSNFSIYRCWILFKIHSKAIHQAEICWTSVIDVNWYIQSTCDCFSMKYFCCIRYLNSYVFLVLIWFG